MEKTKRFFTDWSRFEISWLILSTVIMIVLSVIWGDNLLALISGITGILGVVLAAKGKVSTYIFATVNVAIYALLTFQNHLYGEFMLNAFYYIPMNFIGFYLWSKHKDNESGEVEGKKLTGRQTVILFAAVAVVVLVYWQILSRIGGAAGAHRRDVHRILRRGAHYAGCPLCGAVAALDYRQRRVGHHVAPPHRQGFLSRDDGCHVGCLSVQFRVRILQLEEAGR